MNDSNRRGEFEEVPLAGPPITVYKEQNLGNLYYCEFHIAPSDFESLARAQGWKPMPIDKPVRFTRFKEELSRGRLEIRPFSYVIAPKGAFYSYRSPDGEDITVVFDRVRFTAYLLQHNR